MVVAACLLATWLIFAGDDAGLDAPSSGASPGRAAASPGRGRKAGGGDDDDDAPPPAKRSTYSKKQPLKRLDPSEPKPPETGGPFNIRRLRIPHDHKAEDPEIEVCKKNGGSRPCSVNWCNENNRRRPPYSILYQKREDGKEISETTPLITLDSLKRTMNNNFRWPPSSGFKFPSQKDHVKPVLADELPYTVHPQVHASYGLKTPTLHKYKLTNREIHNPDAMYAECVGKRNVIFGYSKNFHTWDVRPVIESFLRYSTACDDLVMWVDQEVIDEPYTVSGKGRVVHLHQVDWERVGKSMYSGTPTEHVIAARATMMYMWIDKYHGDYEKAIHIDTRDTVLFANPFAALYRYNVTGLTSVGEVHNFRDSDINNQWMGSYSLNGEVGGFIGRLEIHGRPMPVLCAGIFGGDGEAMWDYLTAFKNAFLDSGVGYFQGIDQGIHVYMQAVGLPRASFPHAVGLLDNTVGPAHHWWRGDGGIRRDMLGRFLNCHNEPYAIMHQFDRYKFHWSWIFGNDRTPTLTNETAVGMSERKKRKRAPLDETEDEHKTPTKPKVLRRFKPSGVCRELHAILIVAPREAETNSDAHWRLQMFLAAVQRYHNDCDDIIVLRARPTADEADTFAVLATQETPTVTFYAYDDVPGQKRADRRLAAAHWLRSEAASKYSLIAVFTDVTSHSVATGVYGNMFLPFSCGIKQRPSCVARQASELIGAFVPPTLCETVGAAYPHFALGTAEQLIPYFASGKAGTASCGVSRVMEAALSALVAGEEEPKDKYATSASSAFMASLVAGSRPFDINQNRQPVRYVSGGKGGLRSDTYVVVFEHAASKGEKAADSAVYFKSFYDDYQRFGSNRTDVVVFEQHLEGEVCRCNKKG